MEPTAVMDDAHGVFERVRDLAMLNSKAVARIGGRMAVLCKFVDAVLPQLATTQCRDAARLFRQGVEDAMSLTDDAAMPAEYHAAFLEQANILLNALERKSVALR
jgi:hypothetical protein